MSFQPKVTDDEMRFFQFKARQIFMSQKEDHEWNDFCKRNACNCCSCQPVPKTKTSNEIGIQASRKRILPNANAPLYDRSINAVNSLSSKNLPQALNEIKTKLERIDLALSDWKVPITNKDIINQPALEVKVPSNTGSVNSLNPDNEKRIELIQKSLMASLQRLQSSARLKAKSYPVAIKKNNSGYFLPHELQQQRLKARNAYLASLSKNKNKLERVTFEKTAPNRQDNRLPDHKAVSKPRRVDLHKKPKEKNASLVNMDNLMNKQDLNIENAVDGIFDDIMRETVLVVNNIKQTKNKKLNPDVGAGQNVDSFELMNQNKDKSLKNEKFPGFDVRSVLDNIRQHTTYHPDDKANFESKTEIASSGQQGKLDSLNKNGEFISNQPLTACHDNIPSQIPSLRENHKLFIEPSIVKEIEKQRNEYMKYLEQISQTKKGNFDPWTLAKMVAESLLDDCIEEVSLEIQDLPASLIADLYDKEFLQSL